MRPAALQLGTGTGLGARSGLGAPSGGVGALGRKSGVVIPPREVRDYFISCYDDAGALQTRHRQRHVTRWGMLYKLNAADP
jgi:hypothetical protein